MYYVKRGFNARQRLSVVLSHAFELLSPIEWLTPYPYKGERLCPIAGYTWNTIQG